MKTIRIKTAIVDAAARESGMSAVEFVSKIRSISLGRKGHWSQDRARLFQLGHHRALHSELV